MPVITPDMDEYVMVCGHPKECMTSEGCGWCVDIAKVWAEIGGSYDDFPDIDRISTFFELSYAQYLTIPRSIMQAMPVGWQYRMVSCLDELDETFQWRPKEGRYWVCLKDGRGRYAEDPLIEYRRPNRGYIESIRCVAVVEDVEVEKGRD